MKLSIKQYTTRCWLPVLYNGKPNPPPWGDLDPHLTQCSIAHTSPCAKHPAGRIMPHHGAYIMIIQTFWGDFSSHCGILANIGYQDWSNYVRRRRYVVCPSDELVRDGFKQVAAISYRFKNPISRKTRLSLARVTFKPFRSTFTIGK